MTPFRNDQENPFARDRAWPAMPQAPLRVARARTVLGMGVAEPGIEAIEPAEPRPAESKPAGGGRPRPELRLTPLIGAAAAGAGGLLALFLLIGKP